MIRKVFVASITFALVASVAQATIVHVEVTGVVDWNVIGGDMTGMPSGAPVVMGFDVDSTNFVNSETYPTRGYEIDLSSWYMTVGDVPVPIQDPQPFGPAYFVLRDNDPAVDGFVISRNTDWPQPINVDIPGLTQRHDLDFIRTFSDDTVLSSLDILDAVGTYGLENLLVYGWTIGRFGSPNAEYAYQSISIVPEPATVLSLVCGLMVLSRRRM